MRTSLVKALTSSLAICVSFLAVGCGAGVGDGALGSSESDLVKCGSSSSGGLQGVDVSEFQGDFNFAGRGLSFGFARVSDGDTIIDPTFSEDWAHMKALGLKRGAYQFFRPSESVTAQAAIMVGRVGRLGAGDLPSVADVEVTEGESDATIGAKVREWAGLVEAGTGRKPIIYTYSSFFSSNPGLGSYPLWIADYGPSCPSLPPGWSTWTFWQYSDGNGSLDHDVFNGTRAELDALADGGSNPAPAPDACNKPKGFCTETLQCDNGHWIVRQDDPNACTTWDNIQIACDVGPGYCTPTLQCENGVWVNRLDDPHACTSGTW